VHGVVPKSTVLVMARWLIRIRVTVCAQLALKLLRPGSVVHHCKHLDPILIPVLLIGESDAIVTMNAKACDTLLERLDETAPELFRKVFDCIHSRTAEGCGRTIHRAGCTIRRSATTTFIIRHAAEVPVPSLQ